MQSFINFLIVFKSLLIVVFGNVNLYKVADNFSAQEIFQRYTKIRTWKYSYVIEEFLKVSVNPDDLKKYFSTFELNLYNVFNARGLSFGIANALMFQNKFEFVDKFNVDPAETTASNFIDDDLFQKFINFFSDDMNDNKHELLSRIVTSNESLPFFYRSHSEILLSEKSFDCDMSQMLEKKLFIRINKGFDTEINNYLSKTQDMIKRIKVLSQRYQDVTKKYDLYKKESKPNSPEYKNVCRDVKDWEELLNIFVFDHHRFEVQILMEALYTGNFIVPPLNSDIPDSMMYKRRPVFSLD